MPMERRYFVYLLTNTVNGKVYVGKANDPESRWLGHLKQVRYGHQTPVHRAIRKYGTEAFERTVLAGFKVEEDAYAFERETVLRIGSNRPSVGYNRTEGGDGVRGLLFTDEHRKRLSESHIGKVPTKAQSDALSLGRAYGASEEGRRLKSIRQTGRLLWSEEQRLAIADRMTGHVVSEETRAKIAASLRGRPGRPMNAVQREALRLANSEREISDETRQRMRLAKLGSKHSNEHRERIAASSQAAAQAKIASGLRPNGKPMLDRALFSVFIRERASGDTLSKISKRYKVSESVVCMVVNGKYK